MRSVRLKAQTPLQKELYAAPTQFAAANKKFAVGPNPLERERELDVIEPQNPQQQKRMVEIMEKMYEDSGNDQARKNALEMWRMQLAGKDAESLVKTDFQRRFQFWLLGRGTEEDTKKTFWGRGNMAVHNPEIAAYIDQFLEARANYAMQLALLANRAPTSLLGAYLYFKYIVNGNLKQTKGPNGETWWHLDQSDFLEDYDLFRKYFDGKLDNQYSKLIQPQNARNGAPAFAGAEPYPITQEQKKQWALDSAGDIEDGIAVVESMTNPEPPVPSIHRGPPLPPGSGGAGPPVPPNTTTTAPPNTPTVDPAAILSQVNAQLQQERTARDRAEQERETRRKDEDAARERRFADERAKDRAAEQKRFDDMMALLRESKSAAAGPSTVTPATTEAQRTAERDETEAMFKRVFNKLHVEATVDPTHITDAVHKLIEDRSAKTEQAMEAKINKLMEHMPKAEDQAKFYRDFVFAHRQGLKHIQSSIARMNSQRPYAQIANDIAAAKQTAQEARVAAETAQQSVNERKWEAQLLAEQAAEAAARKQQWTEGELKRLEGAAQQQAEDTAGRFSQLEQESKARGEELAKAIGATSQFSNELQKLVSSHLEAERRLRILGSDANATQGQLAEARAAVMQQNQLLRSTRAEAATAFAAARAKLTELHSHIATYEKRIEAAAHDRSHSQENLAELRNMVAALKSQYEQGQTALVLSEQLPASPPRERAAPRPARPPAEPPKPSTKRPREAMPEDEMPPLEPDVVDEQGEPVAPQSTPLAPGDSSETPVDALWQRVTRPTNVDEQRKAVAEYVKLAYAEAKMRNPDVPPPPDPVVGSGARKQELPIGKWIRAMNKWNGLHGSAAMREAHEKFEAEKARRIKARKDEQAD